MVCKGGTLVCFSTCSILVVTLFYFTAIFELVAVVCGDSLSWSFDLNFCHSQVTYIGSSAALTCTKYTKHLILVILMNIFCLLGNLFMMCIANMQCECEILHFLYLCCLLYK